MASATAERRKVRSPARCQYSVACSVSPAWVQSRLGEVMGKQLRLGVDNIRPLLFQHLSDPCMQLLACATEQAHVGGVLHERVLERVRGW